MIGLVGPASALDELAAAAADIETRRGAAADVVAADPVAAVAVGERAVIELVDAGVDCPVLPVDAGPGLGSVDVATAAGSMDRLAAGEGTRGSHPVLSVRLGDELAGTAVYDVMLVTGEPARISEYSILSDGEIDRFRADGVVAATRAGSHGYAATGGGPIVDATADVLTVVPVAAFTTRTPEWVLDPPIAIRIERNEGEISLLLDDEVRRSVPDDRPVKIAVTDRLETVSIDG